jgi:hypothetical protein
MPPNGTKTIAIPLELHHRLKVAAATANEKLQVFTGKLLERGLPEALRRGRPKDG